MGTRNLRSQCVHGDEQYWHLQNAGRARALIPFNMRIRTCPVPVICDSFVRTQYNHIFKVYCLLWGFPIASAKPVRRIPRYRWDHEPKSRVSGIILDFCAAGGVTVLPPNPDFEGYIYIYMKDKPGYPWLLLPLEPPSTPPHLFCWLPSPVVNASTDSIDSSTAFGCPVLSRHGLCRLTFSHHMAFVQSAIKGSRYRTLRVLAPLAPSRDFAV